MKPSQNLKIGFDAKRIFHNFTGLGNYSRILVQSLLDHAPRNQYHLFTPCVQSTPLTRAFLQKPYILHTAGNLPASFWRSFFMTMEIRRSKLNIYHGLSHELPFGIETTGTKSVVTIHDLIYLYYPGDFKAWDRLVYGKKFRFACETADRIVAVSESTKRDIVREFGIPRGKITVISPSLNPLFLRRPSGKEQEIVRRRYCLPDRFLLSVGSIIPRKNLLNAIQAYALLDRKETPPMVVVGDGSAYLSKVVACIRKKGLEERILFRRDVDFNDLPSFYSMAEFLVFISRYEGFGFPIIEALSQGTPVITTRLSSLPEVAGPGALYVDPDNLGGIAFAMKTLLSNRMKRNALAKAGKSHIRRFASDQAASRTLKLYGELLGGIPDA